MDTLEYLSSALSYLLDSDRRRHIVGGALISLSAFFAGLAITIITIKKEND